MKTRLEILTDINLAHASNSTRRLTRLIKILNFTQITNIDSNGTRKRTPRQDSWWWKTESTSPTGSMRRNWETRSACGTAAALPFFRSRKHEKALGIFGERERNRKIIFRQAKVDSRLSSYMRRGAHRPREGKLCRGISRCWKWFVVCTNRMWTSGDSESDCPCYK